ncbi:MAG: phosphoglycolate phosphatase [Bacteroidetes bacterium HGW-Bacteroidetes-9]|jgi:phosphoglycolate phosphatase|nr:MAG: phosphoglycolate phosphatase [Bacteroidetes bacterium HGW-Bacteroidetes-9]
MKFTHLFFDLDGTLIDSKSGIFNSLQCTLEEIGIPSSDWPGDFNPFIGPPLRISFKTLFGFDDDMAEKATNIYRKYYSSNGIQEFDIFPGIAEALTALHKSGFSISLVTSKAEVYASAIIQETGFSAIFQTISGCELNGDRSDKAELIMYTLNKLGINPSPEILMIGDRNHDLIGARTARISSAAVLYGYGSLEELTTESPLLLIHSPGDLVSKITCEN